jgi:DNA repair protein RecO (recombination protein O)
MFSNTQAIVLHTVKYSDSSVILHAYTEQYGRMAFVVNGIGSKKARFKTALLLPLSIVELEIDYNPNKDIHRVKESKGVYFFRSIPVDPVKNCMTFLMAEVLYRCLKESDVNGELFHFLAESIVLLDVIDRGTANFHLVFLLKLSSFLGFHPNMDNMGSNTYFDMVSGCFTANKPLHANYLSIYDSNVLKELIASGFEGIDCLSFSQVQRNVVLENLVNYYGLHQTGLGQLKSIKVLQTLFN